jgi:hypothetical protein
MQVALPLAKQRLNRMANQLSERTEPECTMVVFSAVSPAGQSCS